MNIKKAIHCIKLLSPVYKKKIRAALHEKRKQKFISWITTFRQDEEAALSLEKLIARRTMEGDGSGKP